MNMSNLRILVVEDEDAIREMLVMVLEQATLLVDAVSSAEQALQALAENHVDLMLLD